MKKHISKCDTCKHFKDFCTQPKAKVKGHYVKRESFFDASNHIIDSCTKYEEKL